MSGLVYQASGTGAPGVLWAVKNGPGTLYRLLWNGTVWTPDTANGWANGKALHYPDGTGDPDAEGVTITGAGPDGGHLRLDRAQQRRQRVSRPRSSASTRAGGHLLTATGEWNLTADLPSSARTSVSRRSPGCPTRT